MASRGAGVCIASVLSPLHNDELVKDIVDTVISASRRFPHRYLGVYREPESLRDAVAGCNVVLLVVGSGGTERIIIDAFEGFDGGLMLVSYNGYNSLAAAVEVAPALRSLGVKAGLHHHRLGYDRRRLDDYIRVAYAIARFRSSRAGLFGAPAPWLVYSGMPASEAVRYGLEVVKIPLRRLYSYFMDLDEREAQDLAKVYRNRTSSRISDEALLNVMRLHLAVKRIVEEEELNAFTIDCFEVIRVLGVTPCFTVGYHNSIGIIAGCEGDLPSLLTMMIASYISGSSSFMGNLSDIEQETIVLSHCTAPLNMGSYFLTTHYETGRPVGVSVTPPKGRVVTIMRLDHRSDKFIVARGTVVASSPRPNLCRTQMVIRVPFDPQILLDESHGNHYTVVLGDHLWKAVIAGRLLGLDVVEFTGRSYHLS